jgi:hypothetical protein
MGHTRLYLRAESRDGAVPAGLGLVVATYDPNDPRSVARAQRALGASLGGAAIPLSGGRDTWTDRLRFGLRHFLRP